MRLASAVDSGQGLPCKLVPRPVASLRGSCKNKCSWFFHVRMRPAPIFDKKEPEGCYRSAGKWFHKRVAKLR